MPFGFAMTTPPIFVVNVVNEEIVSFELDEVRPHPNTKHGSRNALKSGNSSTLKKCALAVCSGDVQIPRAAFFKRTSLGPDSDAEPSNTTRGYDEKSRGCLAYSDSL